MPSLRPRGKTARKTRRLETNSGGTGRLGAKKDETKKKGSDGYIEREDF